LYSDIIEFNKGYQPRTNLVKDETGQTVFLTGGRGGGPLL